MAMTVTELPPSAVMANITFGAFVAHMVGIVAELGIADLLKDGPRDADQLAKSVGANPDALYRVLRALASVGIFSEVADRSFQLTPLAECLRTGVPGSMRSWARAVVADHFWRSLQNLPYSVRTGLPSYDHANGMGVFEYFSRNPEIGRVFDEAMTEFSAAEIPAVTAGYDFSGVRTLVDVAGGHGSLLCAILKANPRLTGVLVDMPAVVEGARQVIADEGLTGRCQVVAQDMFQSVPSGGDAYMMKHIIHDWDDDRSIQILKNCRSAMTNGDGRLLVIETVIQPGNEPNFFKLLDVAMLTISGRERTEKEFRSLYERAGFRLQRVVPTESPMSVIEGVPA